MKVFSVLMISVLISIVLFYELASGQDTITAGLRPGFRAYKWKTGLSSPRQMVAFSNGDVLVVENGKQQITLLYDSTGTNGFADTSMEWGSATNLQSNIQYYSGSVYGHNTTHLFRWTFTPGSRTPPNGYTIVVKNMPSGGHSNRPHDFDPEGRLYISIGSGSNLDSDPSRALIARFSTAQLANLPIDYSTKTIFAIGTRNEAGLRFNRFGMLWGVENGMDDLSRADLGGDIHENNPGEELNLFPDRNGAGPTPIGAFYGYPYCFSEYIINSTRAGGRGTQWAVPDFMVGGQYAKPINDTWCNDSSQVVKPKFLMPAHNAPLDIVWYEQSNQNYNGNWPAGYLDSAFVALHGSWDRSPPSGYRVLQIQFDANHNPIGSFPFFYDPVAGEETGNSWGYRPAGVQFANCSGKDCLLVASDSTGDITAIVYDAVNSPTMTSSVSITASTSNLPTVSRSVSSSTSNSPTASISVSSSTSNSPTASGSTSSSISTSNSPLASKSVSPSTSNLPTVSGSTSSSISTSKSPPVSTSATSSNLPSVSRSVSSSTSNLPSSSRSLSSSLSSSSTRSISISSSKTVSFTSTSSRSPSRPTSTTSTSTTSTTSTSSSTTATLSATPSVTSSITPTPAPSPIPVTPTQDNGTISFGFKKNLFSRLI